MFKLNINSIIKSKIATGIEIILLPSGEYEINVVVLKKQKQTLVTEKQFSKLKSIEELVAHVDLKSSFIIVFNGKGIIHRKVTVLENGSIASLLNKVLPNANHNDFSVQQSPINEQNVFVSIIRNDLLDGIMDELKKNKLTNVSNCLLGPFVLNELFVQADCDGSFNVPGFVLEISNKQIVGLSNSTESVHEPILIGKDKISQEYLIAFGAAMSYFTEAEIGIEYSETITYLKDEYREKRKFELSKWVLMLFCFVILTINYFLFSNYWSKNNEMTSQLVLNQSAIERFEILKKEFVTKKDFLEQNGLLENSRTSFYADRLAEGLPASIRWTDVVVYPEKKKEVGDIEERLLFDKKIINISGKCQKSTELNNWMKEIKKNEWIKDVNLMNYTHDKQLDDGVFSIQVKLK